jgi:hypothetical protein
VTGFLDGDQARGRPVGVGIDGTGALLVADDAGNTVWRVAAADGSVTPKPIGTDRVATASTGVGSAANAGGAAGGQEAATAGQAATPAAPAASPSSPAPDAQSSSGGAAQPQPSQTEIAPAVLPEGTAEEGSAPQGG